MSQRSVSLPPNQSLLALVQLMDITDNALDLQSLAQVLLRRTLTITAMTSGSIWLRGQDQPTCLACWPDRQFSLLPLDPTIMRALESGRPEFGATRGERGRHVLPALVLPLTARGEVIGALALAGEH